MTQEPIDQLDAEVAEINDQVEKPQRDQVKDFKDLTRYMVDKEWRSISLWLKKSINLTEQSILEKWRGDIELKYSPHDVLFRRCDLYSEVIIDLKSPKAEAFKEYLIREIDAMSSQIIFKVVDGMGNSLDTPVYSATDMQRHDLKAFLRLEQSLQNYINSIDPQKKDTKRTMNPYDENYTATV